jgi:choline dehydrogenase-like flavoprotein
MHLDANDKSFNRSTINCDIAIVGAGPAGIILAEQFKNTPYQVCVLESGGFAADSSTQQLAEGSLDAPTPMLDKNYISQHSVRHFGGTGSVWGGYCRQLDAVDFEQRDLPFAHQWPISKADLIDYYPWHALEKKYDTQVIEGTALQVKYYERVVYPFDVLLKNLFVDDKNIQIITHATVTDLIQQRGNSLAHINVVSNNQKSFQVNAKVYVLACGGIGNVKILLNASGVKKNGVGNQHDQVGRHFMEHPHFQFFGPPALLWLADKKAGWLYHDERYKPTLSFSDDKMRGEKLLNFSAQPSNAFEDGYKGSGANMYRPNFKNLSAKNSQGAFYAMAFRTEQSPNAESRVTLTNDKDALGLRRVHLNWQLTAVDKTSLFRSIHLLAEELGKASMGRVRLLVDENAPWQTMVGGGHLMGTTRMSEKPEDGVVDKNCKVHGVDNLFIAGSSVFATSGVANPTLTLMAISRRLAAHLKATLVDTPPNG